MIIAVTYKNGEVFQHFGQSKAFKLYTIRDNAVVSSAVRPIEGEGHGALAGLLKGWEVEKLICGGIGAGAREALAGVGIDLYPGASGNADAQVQALLDGALIYDPDTQCNHHDHDHDHH